MRDAILRAEGREKGKFLLAENLESFELRLGITVHKILIHKKLRISFVYMYSVRILVHK